MINVDQITKYVWLRIARGAGHPYLRVRCHIFRLCAHILGKQDDYLILPFVVWYSQIEQSSPNHIVVI
jgi:galactokinase